MPVAARRGSDNLRTDPPLRDLATPREAPQARVDISSVDTVSIMNDDPTTRRDFLGTTLKAGAVLSVAGVPTTGVSSPMGARLRASDPTARHPLRILILGGTAFMGPHQIAYALGRGHSVTTFTRGQTQPDVHQRLFREVEQLVGDREGDLSALAGRSWDAVIDNSGRRVEWTTASAELLRDTVETYLYTSSSTLR